MFDGVPGDPRHPKAFAAVKLRAADGVLGIAQGDYKPGMDVKLALGVWHYTGDFDATDGSTTSKHGDSGVYGFVQAPLPGLAGWSGWVRAGLADPNAQDIAGYVGAGIAGTGVIAKRSQDRIGLAVAHAIVSPAARLRSGLPSSETTIEATYQLQLSAMAAVQPDLQYVLHPAGAAGVRSATVLGLRIILTATSPRKSAADQAADPNAAPDASDPPSP